MAALDGLDGLPSLSMQRGADVVGTPRGTLHRRHARLVVVAIDTGRNFPFAGDRLPEERLRGDDVPAVWEEDVHDVAVLIDGPIEVARGGAVKEKHLVHPPALAEPPTVRAPHGGDLGAEGVGPRQDRPGGESMPPSARISETCLVESG